VRYSERTHHAVDRRSSDPRLRSLIPVSSTTAIVASCHAVPVLRLLPVRRNQHGPYTREQTRRRRRPLPPADIATMLFWARAASANRPLAGCCGRSRAVRRRWRGECLCLLYELFVSVFAFLIARFALIWADISRIAATPNFIASITFGRSSSHIASSLRVC
jgi:hypothetical protein